MAKLNDFLPKLYLPLLALLCFLFAWQPLQGIDDFWAHAAIGRWIAQHGSVPTESLFIWAPGTPIPWIYHSWLSQLTFYKLLDWGGSLERGAAFALLLTYLVTVATLVWLWLIWTKRNRITSLVPFLFAIALWCASPRFHPRPELVSGLFLCPVLTFLLVWTEKRAQNQLPSHLTLRIGALAALFALWANLHGGVVTGLVFIALTLVGEIAQDKMERRDGKPTLMLFGVLLLCAAAINLNPYGIHYWESLRAVGGPMFALLNEWKPLWKPPFMAPEGYMVTAMLAILALSGWVQSPQRRVAQLFWLLFATYAFVVHRRQIQQFAQVSLIVMAANAAVLDTQRFWNTWKPKNAPEHAEIPHSTRLMARLCVVCGLLVAVPGLMSADLLPLHSLSPRLPIRAAQFIQTKCQNARLFTDYASSSYLDWHLAGQPPVFIDLLNAYPDHLLGDYFDIIYLTPQGLRLLDDLKITHIFVKNPADEKTTQFARYMVENPRWTPIYQGSDATIWIRRPKSPHGKNIASLGAVQKDAITSAKLPSSPRKLQDNLRISR